MDLDHVVAAKCFHYPLAHSGRPPGWPAQQCKSKKEVSTNPLPIPIEITHSAPGPRQLA